MHKQFCQSNKHGGDAQTILSIKQTGWEHTDNPVKHLVELTNRVGMHRQSIQKNKQVGDPLTILSNKQTGWGCIDNLVEQTNRVGMHRQSCK